MTSAYDAAGRRVRLTWMDGSFVTFEHLVTGETSAIHDAGGTPGALLLGRYGYDTYGRRTSLERGNGTMTTYGYDPASRLASLTHDLAGTAQDVTFSYSHNPAGQIVTRSSSNAAYNYVPPASTESAAANGLNQLSNGSVGALAHDGRGNVVSDGAETYAFTSENRLSRIGAYPIASDPLMRIYDDGFNRLTYDGPHLAAMHYGGSLASRHVFGPGDDEPLASRYGSGFTWYHADERGSVLARSGAAGTAPLITTWSEAGDPGTAGGYQFGFTGQLRLSAGVHDFKARLWSPRAGGRFMNPDPIGYGDGMNQYAYVAGDPVNATDPSGLEAFRRGGTLIFTKRFDASGNSGGRAGNRGQQGFRACPAGDICVNAQRLSALIDVSGLLGTLNASSGRYQGERSESANAEVEEPQRPTCLSLTEPVVVTQSQVSVSSITGAGIGLIGFRGTESGITGTVASAAWHVVNGQFGVSVNVGVGAASTLRDLLGRGGQIGISFGYVGIEFSTSDDFRRFSGVNVTGGPRSMGLSISRTLGTLRSISGRLCSTRE
jgi:RHS repeat-associated protein